MSVYLSVCVGLYVCLFVCRSVCLFICRSVCRSVCLSIFLYVYLSGFVGLYVCLTVSSLPTTLIVIYPLSPNVYGQVLSASLFNRLTQLEVLNIEENGITELPPGLFEETPLLRELYVASNYIFSLHNDVFKGLHRLEHLDLGNNNLELPNVYGLFRHQTSLQVRSLSLSLLSAYNRL